MGPLARLAAGALLGSVLPWVFAAAAVAPRETWYMIDTPSVVCTEAKPPAPGAVNITVPLDGIYAASRQSSPHIFTLYRTTKQAALVTLRVLDAKGRSVVSENTVELRQLARRLSAAEPEEASGREAYPRDLRGRVGGGFHAGPRGGFRSSHPSVGGGKRSSNILSSPRRRVGTGARRRVASISSAERERVSSVRRRGAPANSHIPPAGVGGSHYQNMYGQSYGFTRPQTMSHYYPGGYTQTGYGYSGANSYTPPAPGSRGNVMMAGLGGAALGFGASYLFSRWNSYPSCYSGTSWTGSCGSCYASLPQGSCQMGPPRVNAHRDDLMSTGFWPDDWASPLTVIISAVEGADFSAALLCPQNLTGASLARSGVAGADLFFTLTQVDELSPRASNSSALAWGAVAPLLIMIGLCACICAASAVHKQMENSKDHGRLPSVPEEDEDACFAHGQHPVVMGAPVNMASPVDDLALRRQSGAVGEGFMSTAAPNGISWRKYCESHPVEVDPASGMLAGAWGECLAWAKVFEVENPGWRSMPEYAGEGPCGQVLDALVGTAGSFDVGRAEEAAERLEQACEAAAAVGKPLPVIHHSVAAE